MKECSVCKETKIENNFRQYKRHGIVKRMGVCNSCSSMERRVTAKEARQANPLCKFCSCNLVVGNNWTAHMKKESTYCCKECHRNRPSQTFEKNKESALKRKYGISLDEFNAISESQSHLCAICERPETHSTRPKNGGMKLAVDHDHDTGKVRGLLCLKCNRALGLFEDNQEVLLKAIGYLKKHS